MPELVILNPDQPRTFALVLGEGESVTDALDAFAAAQRVTAAAVTAIGGFSAATLGFFDLAERTYAEIPVREQAEVLSLVGDIGRHDDGRVALHAHAVLGLRDGSTRGGHLLAATVRPTLEVMVTESPGELRRRYREDLGLALIDPGESRAPRTPGFTPDDPLRHGLAP
ncbi:PPC domain-containing DNA-binding protein [Actinophytocola glycyrrhizae]|uniref:PPC domain-containing DNA-binding protein n=1 Tax=Actinophytocola glycyrrhizae TaxID=2044873 RepID=A0ABV9S877_9PSEU